MLRFLMWLGISLFGLTMAAGCGILALGAIAEDAHNVRTAVQGVSHSPTPANEKSATAGEPGRATSGQDGSSQSVTGSSGTSQSGRSVPTVNGHRITAPPGSVVNIDDCGRVKVVRGEGDTITVNCGGVSMPVPSEANENIHVDIDDDSGTHIKIER